MRTFLSLLRRRRGEGRWLLGNLEWSFNESRWLGREIFIARNLIWRKRIVCTRRSEWTFSCLSMSNFSLWFCCYCMKRSLKLCHSLPQSYWRGCSNKDDFNPSPTPQSTCPHKTAKSISLIWMERVRNKIHKIFIQEVFHSFGHFTTNMRETWTFPTKWQSRLFFYFRFLGFGCVSCCFILCVFYATQHFENWRLINQDYPINFPIHSHSLDEEIFGSP